MQIQRHFYEQHTSIADVNKPTANQATHSNKLFFDATTPMTIQASMTTVRPCRNNPNDKSGPDDNSPPLSGQPPKTSLLKSRAARPSERPPERPPVGAPARRPAIMIGRVGPPLPRIAATVCPRHLAVALRRNALGSATGAVMQGSGADRQRCPFFSEVQCSIDKNSRSGCISFLCEKVTLLIEAKIILRKNQ